MCFMPPWNLKKSLLQQEVIRGKSEGYYLFFAMFHDKIARGPIILLKTNILKKIRKFEALALNDGMWINSL